MRENIIMRNTIYFPTLCCGVGKGQGCKTLKIEVKLATRICRDWETLEENEMYTFSACGTGMGYCGQCLDVFNDKAAQYIMPQEKQKLFNRIFEIWNEYHLNNLQAGTKAQRKCLNDAARTMHYAKNYDIACNYLERNELLVDNGYKYGSGWLCKPIPTHIIEEILTWGNIQQEPKDVIEIMRKQLYREYKKSAS